tara:strand:- start:1684 stop:4236 length:2553 start_codon:yes stop_codon:yes gene_type:complete
MAIGVDYAVKQDLIDAVVARVFDNKTFAITGEGLQSSLCDMIESLWDNSTGGSGGGTAIVNTTYADLLALVNAGTLAPGTFYRFTYENVHDIVNSSLANTQVPGYTSITETLYVFASSANKLSGFALSEEHKYDIIEYDITQATHGSPSVADNGNIIRRYDIKNDNEAYFDFRNHTVARFALANPWTTGLTTLLRSRIGNYTDGLGVAKTVISVMDDSSIEDNSLVDDISDIFESQPYYPFNSGAIELFYHNNVTVTSTSVAYFPSFHTTDVSHVHTGIRLGKDVKDILITNGGSYSTTNKKACSDVKIDNHACGCTVSNSSNVTIGKHSMVTVVRNSDNVSIGDNCSRVICIDSDNNEIEKRCSSVVVLQGEENKIDNSSSDILIRNSNYNELGVKNEKILIIRTSHKNVFGNNCGGITLANTTANDFRSSCNDIDIITGGYNRFAQGCTTIGLVGEKDPAYNGGSYYSMYSTMSHNTFGVSCSNIMFKGMNGLRGCTFGDECKTLMFGKHSDTTYNPGGLVDGGTVSGPALMNATFCRGIQNKTFYDYPLIGFSILTPSSSEKDIYHYNWHSQQILLYENRDNRHSAPTNEETETFYIEVKDSMVADNTDFSFSFRRVKSPTNWEGDVGMAVNTPVAVSYNSGSGATKASITAGLIAAVATASPGSTTSTQGAGFLLSGMIYGAKSYPAESIGVMIQDSNVDGKDVGPVIWSAGNSSGGKPIVNKIMVTYESDGSSGSPVSGSGFKNANGKKGDTIPGAPAGAIVNSGVIGNANPSNKSRGYGIDGFPSGGAYIWTKAGYPLSITMCEEINPGAGEYDPYSHSNVTDVGSATGLNPNGKRLNSSVTLG